MTTQNVVVRANEGTPKNVRLQVPADPLVVNTFVPTMVSMACMACIPVYPVPGDVRQGIDYGPVMNNYEGTLVISGGSGGISRGRAVN